MIESSDVYVQVDLFESIKVKRREKISKKIRSIIERNYNQELCYHIV